MIWYRLSLKFGIRKQYFPVKTEIRGDFFQPDYTSLKQLNLSKEEIVLKADKIYQGHFTYYHYHHFNLNPIPNWFYDPFTKKSLHLQVQKKHWTEINEFDLNTGDIKNLWEISRFDWLTDLGRAYAVSGNEKYLKRINLLLNDWSFQNTVNEGINWRCGQETSIRVMKLFYAALTLNQLKTVSENLFDWVYAHLERINGNIRYAIAQDNNHGTSEAAGLYIGACWLLSQNNNNDAHIEKQLNKFKKKGRKILEKRVDKLILSDGTFSQKSVNYHRVVVDTLSWVLFAMQEFEEPEFSASISNKLENLGNWLLQMVSNKQGEVPNLGANDGALFMQLHNCDYRDFRPSIQLFFALLRENIIWKDKKVEEVLLWHNIIPNQLKKYTPQLTSHVVDKEFIQIKYGDIIIRLKATQDNFRPGNDVFHIDVWCKGENVLIDSGSYSYNSKKNINLNSIAAHNSLQFGESEPMPKISSFLNGAWVKVKGDKKIKESKKHLSWSGKYKDYRGNIHQRKVKLNKSKKKLIIEDYFDSNIPDELKILRYHVSSSFFNLINLTVKDGRSNSLTPQKKIAYHSLYYRQKRKHEILEFYNKAKRGKFITTIDFK